MVLAVSIAFGCLSQAINAGPASLSKALFDTRLSDCAGRHSLALVQLQAIAVVSSGHSVSKDSVLEGDDTEDNISANIIPQVALVHTFTAIEKLIYIAPKIAGPAPRHLRLRRYASDTLVWYGSNGTTMRNAQAHAAASSPVLWGARTVGGLLVLSFFLKMYCDRARVELPDDGKYPEERGSPCWNPFCVACLGVLLLFTFWMTLVQVSLVNASVGQSPVSETTTGGHTTTTTKFPIKDPGERSFQACIGVAFSASMGCMTLFYWRHSGNVAISSGLMARYAARGGTISCFIALVLEMLGGSLLGSLGIEIPATMMALVGISEEGAKMTAFLLGTWLIGSAMEETTPRCCGQWWRVLIESPRALMLAGMCTGFGFMIVENVEYLISSAATPGERTAVDGKDTEMVGAAAVNFATWFTIAIRVILNIHPWLAGITAGRIATIAFQHNYTFAWLRVEDMMWAIWPSAFAHGLFDLLVGSPFLGIFMCPLTWYLLRREFWRLWDDFGVKADVASAVEAS